MQGADIDRKLIFDEDIYFEVSPIFLLKCKAARNII